LEYSLPVDHSPGSLSLDSLEFIISYYAFFTTNPRKIAGISEKNVKEEGSFFPGFSQDFVNNFLCTKKDAIRRKRLYVTCWKKYRLCYLLLAAFFN